jgi:prepilin-type N-terminal cleavage/methylation domain-containing protein
LPSPVNGRAKGMSLLELILVLAVLVAVAAIALPALHGPMEDQKLRKAGDLVLAEWGQARVLAMKTGTIHVFKYDIGADTYRIEPWVGELDQPLEASTEQVEPVSQPLDPLALQDPRVIHSPLGIPGLKLPDGVRFFMGDTKLDARVMTLNTETNDLMESETGAAIPIVFYPDGTTSAARLVLTNDRFFVDLRLRALTGLSRSSGLVTQEELTP